MSRILVTGADGFIGSHLVEELVRQGRSVRAFVLYNSFDHWGWLDSVPAEVKDKIEVVAGDVRDRNCVETGDERLFERVASRGLDRHSLFLSGR